MRTKNVLVIVLCLLLCIAIVFLLTVACIVTEDCCPSGLDVGLKKPTILLTFNRLVIV